MVDDIRFINNGLAFLFSEMKYGLNGIQIQKLTNPGISSTLKRYRSYNKSEIVSHYNAAWDDDIKNVNKDFIESGVFNGCINLRDLFGFREDYKRILINCNQQASLDMNVIKPYKNNEIVTDAPKLKDVKIYITKILWRMPIVKVSDKEKIQLLKVMCEYPFLLQNISHSWKVKTSNKFEKPRYVLIGFQTDRKNSMSKPMSYFDHCKIKIVKKSYYARDNITTLLTRSDTKKLSPIKVIDMSRQNDNMKTSAVDLRIEIETEEAFTAFTSAYCLILHDQIITYNPFNGESLIFLLHVMVLGMWRTLIDVGEVYIAC
ncbi:hypothetical protein AGLY_002779 [Aphis glycines]|uniref:Double jelly roll-like domain-containing protein n=1 Tax=Aphis glycines TaxID=307491 RepID=A0A6G0U176_APHGL|nr:hypothetical protein AGLY_002779 [Aphis glycines]